MGMRLRLGLAMVMAVAAMPQAWAYDWATVATISDTVGVNNGHLCVGLTRGDIGCAANAPSLNANGDLTVYGNLNVSGSQMFQGVTFANGGVSATGTITATTFYGNGSGITGIDFSANPIDRIISGTTNILATQNQSLTFTTAGALRATIGTNGNVGISTTNPREKLTVDGSILLSPDNSIRGNVYWDGATYRYYAAGFGQSMVMNSSLGYLIFGNTATSGAANAPATVLTRMVLAPGGGLALGGGLYPSTTLDVSGTLKIANGGEACDTNRKGSIRYTGSDFQVCYGTGGWSSLLDASGTTVTPDRITSSTTNVITNGVGQSISFTVNGVTTGYFYNGQLVANGVSTTGAGKFNNVSVTTNADIGNNLTVAGNVGIGTTNPSTTLHVSGTVTIGAAGANPGSLQLRGNNGNVHAYLAANAVPQAELYGYSGLNLKSGVAVFQIDTDTKPVIWKTYSGQTFNFVGWPSFGGEVVMKNNSDGTETFHTFLGGPSYRTLFPTGLVGIGVASTTLPSTTLQVVGSLRLGSESSSTLATCDTNRIGAIKYDTGAFYVCQSAANGWESLATTGANSLADRITSGTTQVITNGPGNSISFTVGGVTTGYFYNGQLVASAVSTTGPGKFNNVSVTTNVDVGGQLGVGASLGISPGISFQIGSGLVTDTVSRTIRLNARSYIADIYSQFNAADAFGVRLNSVQVLRATASGMDRIALDGGSGLVFTRFGGSVPFNMSLDGGQGGAYLYGIGFSTSTVRTPSSTLHINGAIQIAAETSATTNTCDTNRSGAIRYNGTNFQVCYGTGGWATLADASSTVATADRITSGTAQVIANGTTNSISITEAGVTTGYYYGGVWVAGGVSTTGLISTTGLYVTGTTNLNGTTFLNGVQFSFNSAAGNFLIGRGNMSGSNNSAFGYGALSSASTGGSNVAIGNYALQTNSIGSNNAVLGYGVGTYSSGSRNVLIGRQAGLGSNGASPFSDAVVIGAYAGGSLTTGMSNTIIGSSAARTLTTGNNNIIIGSYIQPYSDTGSNQLNIGNAVYGDLGSGTNNANKIGINVPSPTANLEVSGTISGTILTGKFVGDGSGLTNLAAAFVADRIVSGTAQMIANSNSNSISITEAGVTTGYYYNGVWVTRGISTTGVISSTGLYVTGTTNVNGNTIFTNGYTTFNSSQVYFATIGGTQRGYIDNQNNIFNWYGPFQPGSIRNGNGTAAGPTYTFSGDTNSGMFHPAVTSTLAFSTSSTERLRITSTGLVGINTATPTTQLEVNGTVSATNFTGTFTGDGSGLTGVIAAGSDRIISNTAQVIANGNSNSISITEAGVTTGYYYGGVWVAGGVSTTGPISATTGYFSSNVGIGTSSGSSKLNILGYQSNSPLFTNTWLDLGTTVGHAMGMITLNANGGSGLAGIGLQSPDANNGNLTFSTRGSSTWTERMRITSSGLVGIGTSNPSNELEINGGNSPRISLRSNSETVGEAQELGFQVGSGANASANTVGLIKATITQASPSALKGSLSFFTNAGDSALERMTIMDSGNVGIGTVNPSTTLHVAGTIRIANGGETCDTNRSGAIRYNGASFQVCYGTGGWANLTDASGTTTTADRITSGTAQVIANGLTNSISITEAGVTTGYYYGGVWVAKGISTTGAGNFNNVSVSTNVSVTGNLSAANFIGNGSGLTGLSSSSVTLGIDDLTDAISNYPSSTLFMGQYAGYNNTGIQNTGLGLRSLYNNTSGYNNTATGFNALYTNTTGYSNSAFGYHALYSNDNGYMNTAMGDSALQNNTNGTTNSAFGWRSMDLNSTGSNNVGIGYMALRKNTTGSRNVAVGMSSLYGADVVNNSVGIGWGINSGATGGQYGYGTFVGDSAAYYLTTGGYNTFLGASSGYNVTTGASNTLVGALTANTLTTGGNNIVLGYQADVPTAATSNYLNIGNAISGSLGGSLTFIGGIKANGIVTATYFEGDGSRLTNLASAFVADRIVSNTAQVIANGNTNSISITEAGVTTGYYYGGVWVAGGVSTTGTISATRLFSAQRLETRGGLYLNQGSGATDNLMYLGSATSGPVNASMGFFAAGIGSAGQDDGPYFLARGNSFSGIANQRGNVYFSAGNPSPAPGAAEGTINFLTGTNNDNRMRIDWNGNVGINIGSFAPTAKLDVYGTVSATLFDATRGGTVSATNGYFTNISATHYYGDGSGLTGVIAAGSDRITSGTAQMIANGNTNSISITEAGVTTGYYYGGVWVAKGVSTTGAISATTILATQSLAISSTDRTLMLNINDGANASGYGYLASIGTPLLIGKNGFEVGKLQLRGGSGQAGAVNFMSNHGLDIYGNNPSSNRIWLAASDFTSGSVGINLTTSTTPRTTLDVSGTLKLADGGEACDANRLGAIKYITNAFYICQNTSNGWEPIATTGASSLADRITSGTTQVITNGPGNSISFTVGGVTTGYFYNGQLVASGISTTGAGNFNNVSVSTNVSVTGNVSAAKFIGDGSLLTNISASAITGIATDRITSGTASAYIAPNGTVTMRGLLDIITNTSVVGVGQYAAVRNTGQIITAVGYQAAADNTANEVTAVGYQAAASNTFVGTTALGTYAAATNTADGVTGVGYAAAQQNSGVGATFTGFGSGWANTGHYTTAMGYRAGRGNSGVGLVAMGYNTGLNNTFNNVVLLGYGIQSATKDNQVILGNESTVETYTTGMIKSLGITTSGSSAISGTLKIAYGGEACDAARLGAIRYTSSAFYVCQSTAAGWQTIGTASSTVALSETIAINDLSDASASTALGSLYMGNGTGNTATGVGNVALGINALTGAATNFNVAIGSYALNASTAAKNTAIGYTALASSTTGQGNVGIGFSALKGNITGSNNLAMGNSTMAGNLNGVNNTANGAVAMFSNATGSNNAAYGMSALYYANPVTNTIAIGFQSGYGSNGLTTFQNGTFVGVGTGQAITTGNDNTFLGAWAGATTTTGSSNTLIGALAYAPTAATSNYLNIANAISGSTLGGSMTFIGGIVANGIVTATYFEGDGSHLTGIATGASDRIISGTTSVIANGATNTISFTTAGNVVGSFTSAGVLNISSTGTLLSGGTAYFNLRNGSGSLGTFLGYNNADNSGIVGATAGATGGLTFWTANSGVWKENMRITTAGNVGISTTTPQAALDVSGSLRISNGGETCGAGKYGTMRVINGVLSLCRQ